MPAVTFNRIDETHYPRTAFQLRLRKRLVSKLLSAMSLPPTAENGVYVGKISFSMRTSQILKQTCQCTNSNLVSSTSK